ncbi:MAG: hypothetical protein MK135_00045 [Polyangiaceae bacterium]|nr:hypothetical protein [Polyangiaceae bacterium]
MAGGEHGASSCYAQVMGELLACPFCRELYSRGEAEVCPGCELRLVPLHRLPPSYQAEQEDHLEGTQDAPYDRNLGWRWLGRGRGPLLFLSSCGLLLFFCPWASFLRPDPLDLSGFDMAKTFAPWLFGGAIGWFLLIPLLLTRTTIRRLRGLRVIASLFSALTLGEVLLLAQRPPSGSRYFSYGFEYEWAFWLSGFISAVALYFSFRLGGSIEDLRDLPFSVDQQLLPGQKEVH